MNKHPRPTGDRLLVRKDEAAGVTKGGVILPDAYRPRVQTGVVVAAGPGGVSPKGALLPMRVIEGQKVLFAKYGGQDVKVSVEDNLFVVLEGEVQAVRVNGGWMPYLNRAICRRLPAPARSRGGIILHDYTPDELQAMPGDGHGEAALECPQEYAIAEVLRVGPQVTSEGNPVKPDVFPGDKVLVHPHAGSEIPALVEEFGPGAFAPLVVDLLARVQGKASEVSVKPEAERGEGLDVAAEAVAV